MTEPGTKVLITEDVRPGNPASGQVGVYEGDLPRTIRLGQVNDEAERIDWWPNEFWYAAYASGDLKLPDGTPARDIYIEQYLTIEHFPADGSRIAVPMRNPCIRLEDGSIIWGAECWWCEYSDGMTLEDARALTDAKKDVVRGIYKAISELAHEH